MQKEKRKLSVDRRRCRRRDLYSQLSSHKLIEEINRLHNEHHDDAAADCVEISSML